MRFSFLLFLVSTACSCEPATYAIALKQRNVDNFLKLADDIADPLSAQYAQYLSIQEIDSLLAPSEEVKAVVIGWLRKEFGEKSSIRDFGDALFVTTDSCSFVDRVPDEMAPHVDFVSMLPTRNVLGVAANVETWIGSGSNKADSGLVPAEVIRRIYDIDDQYLSYGEGASVAPIEFLSAGGFSQRDLASCQQLNGSPLRPINQTHIIGPDQGRNGESQLDVQVQSQVTPESELWFWNSANWMYDWAVSFARTPSTPEIVSLSWGWNEQKQCDIANCTGGSNELYVTRTDIEFAKLGAMGTTIVVASGDAGAPGRTDEACIRDDPDHIRPVYPASSPYVVSVGATYIVNNASEPNWRYSSPVCTRLTQCANGTHERPTNFQDVGWTTGGGFNAYSKRPAWQSTAVENYLARTDIWIPPDKFFNKFGRGYPDLSAVGHNCMTVNLGLVFPADGTSCSAPMVAGMLAIVNGYLKQNGRPPLGRASPLLYYLSDHFPQTFQDITEGNNACTEATCCEPNSEFGFEASIGWDPVSGLGTPRLRHWIHALDRLLI